LNDKISLLYLFYKFFINYKQTNMKFTITVPATVEMVIEIKANNIFEAREMWSQGEFEVVSEETYDHDFDYVELS